jgi:hypothetical protein
MAFGDARYKARVAPETRAFALHENLGDPEWFVPGVEAAPYYPDAFRQFVSYAAEQLLASGRPEAAARISMGDEGADTPSSGSSGNDHGRGRH